MIFPYQIVILVLVSIFIGYALLNYKKGDISFLAMIAWILVWAIMIYMTFSFNLISLIEQIFAAQAGLNLIVVFSIITLFFISHVLFIQITRIRKEITQIVRYIGLKEADRLESEI